LDTGMDTKLGHYGSSSLGVSWSRILPPR
jgi:hypothetical protein